MKKYRLLAAGLLLSATACRKAADPAVTAGLVHPVYSVQSVTTPAAGKILLSPYSLGTSGEGRILVLDERGQVLLEKETGGAAFGFRKWALNGKTRYTWTVDDPAVYHLPGINQLTGYVVIADENLNELKRVHLQSYGSIAAGNTVDLDVHDFILLDDDHYLTMSYYPKKVANIPAALQPDAAVTVVAPVIQEVVNNTVIWQWDATDYPELYAVSAEGNQYGDTTKPQDYLHMNSMILDPKDGNLICSFRHTNQVLKISRQNGSILWRLGGTNSDFPLAPGQAFLRQHHATLLDSNGTLLLFDNGHITDRPYSRVLEIGLNEGSRQVTSFRAYTIPEPFSQFMGSVQKLGDHYFISGGTADYVLEVNAQTGEKVLELKSVQTSYRAYKYE